MSKDIAEVGLAGGYRGRFVSREDVACYRLYAANCVEIAENVSDTERRLFLLRMAQAWGHLADQVEKIGNRSSGVPTGEPPPGPKPGQT
jgi:hypothetical protein